MSKRPDKIRHATDELLKYITSQLKESEHILIHGYATPMNWKRSWRCFISMTNERLIILWLKKKYDEVEAEQGIQYVDISSCTYKYISYFPYHGGYNQKPFTPRLYIELADKEFFAFAFDNQCIAKAILEELKRRLPSFYK